MFQRGRWRILAQMVQVLTPMPTTQVAQTDRRRRFVLVECPFCREPHDAMVDGGRLKTPCGREAEALTMDRVMLARIWGREGEWPEMRPARIV